MSKKIMKRSLMLGTLMAFVITGSAMAAEVEGMFLNGYSFNNVAEELIVNGQLGHTNIDIDAKSLTVNNATGANGLHVYGKMDIDVAGDVTITSKSNGIICPGDTSGGPLTINANRLLIYDAAWGIHNERNSDKNVDGVMNINVKDLIIDAKNGITNNSGLELKIVAENIDITASEHYGIAAVGGTGGIVLNASNDLTIKYTGNTYAALRSITGDITVGAGGTTIIEGDIRAKGDSSITASFNGTDSSFTGAVETVEGANTTLNMNGATWNVTGESTVSEIGGTNANIKVEDAKVAEGWVKVGKVNAEKLTVSTETEDSNTQETLNALSEVAVLVDENGETIAKAATQVQLKNAIYDNVVGKVTEEGVEITEKDVASANVSVNDMVAIGMMSWRAEMNDMNKRMGELRNANGEHGVWVRMVRGESEYNSVKNQYNQYQLGYDEKLSVDKRWTVGAALSYTDAENNFAEGTGESTNKAFSVYGSKLNDDGTFVDLIAKYARLDNDFKTYSGMGDAEYDTNAYSFSAEVGKRIQQGKGLWIEPQVELTYGKVSAVDYVTKNNVAVAQDGMESLIGRIGFSLGKDIEKGNVYARASYLYDFDGETKAVLDGDAVLTNDLGGGWWEVGVGANINLSKATYIYADVEKTFGGEVDTNWQWNLGVRYSF